MKPEPAGGMGRNRALRIALEENGQGGSAGSDGSHERSRAAGNGCSRKSLYVNREKNDMKLHVIYTVRDGLKQAYYEALEKSGAPDKVRAEEGCLKYEYCPEEGPENELHLYEEWASPEHQKVHMTQPHMAEIMAVKKQYVTETKLIRL